MHQIKLLLFVFAVISSHALLAQTYISAEASGNYWQHTELTGIGIGFGLEQKIKRYKVSVNYAFGYGTYHRFKNFDNINYDYWTTVLVDEGSWSSDLGLANKINKMKAKSDYGKQHQLSLRVSRELFVRNNNSLNFGLGIYSSLVEHFFTFSNTEVYYLDIAPFYRGPLNYIPVSHQKFLTYGFNTTFQWDHKVNDKIWSPFLEAGFGPRYSSYVSLGLRLSTKLKKKKK